MQFVARAAKLSATISPGGLRLSRLLRSASTAADQPFLAPTPLTAEESEALADLRFETLRKSQSGQNRAREHGALQRPRRRAGSGKTSARGVIQLHGEEEHRSTVQDRKFLTHDGISGRTVFERERNASKARLQRGASAIADYRLGNKGSNDSSSFAGKELEEIEQDVEDQIQIAIANGDFSNLDGEGRPIQRYSEPENPYLDRADKLGFNLLKRHGFVPEWIEKQQRIHKDLDTKVQELAGAWSAGKCEPTVMFITRKDTFRRDLIDLNKKVRDYNMTCPTSAQMHPFDFMGEVRRAKQKGEVIFAEHQRQRQNGTSSKLASVRVTPLRDVFRRNGTKMPSVSVNGRSQTGSVWSRVANAFRGVDKSRS